MSLLVDMATASLDPEYRDAHARRAGLPLVAPGEGGARPGAAVRRTGLGGVPLALSALLLLAGLVTGIAASQVRKEQRQASAIRLSLVDDVRRQTSATDALARQEAALRHDVATVRGRALGQGAQGRALAEQLEVLELATGALAVKGPGLVVTLDDAPASDQPAGADPTQGEGRIYDRDLQDITNALWTAGAEAMSINGERLTGQTTIRSAGEAVLVDFRPLNPPYVLRAIGQVDTMEPRLVDGPVARRFQTWTSLYGITFEVTRAKELRLPAAGPAALRHVRLGAR
jgi:uncharacterized protein YlxW (UPF0749 family)